MPASLSASHAVELPTVHSIPMLKPLEWLALAW